MTIALPPTSPNADASTTFSPFRHQLFRDVWLANLASRFGGLIQSVGASWMMVSLGATPTLISLVQTSTTLPIVLFSLVAGALADTVDRRRLMLIAQFFMLAVSTALTVAAYAGLLTPWLLLVFTFLIGCGAALNGPAWQASVGDMVPRAELPSAVALNSMGFNVARSTGPAIGGLIVAWASAALAFAVNAVSYLGLIVVLARWHPPAQPARGERQSLGRAIFDGVRYITLSPGILAVLARSIVFGVGASAIPALTPLIARDLIGGGALTYGLLLGAFGVGAVVGALFSANLRARLSSEAVVRTALFALAVGAMLAAVSRSAWVTVPALFVGGAGWVLALSTFNVTVQMAAPRWVVGRALATYQMTAFGGLALGSWAWGAATEAFGLPTALLASAGVVLACVALGLRFPLPPAEALDLDPLGRWREPLLSLAIEPRSGPIVTTIEYRVAARDAEAFAAAMAQRQRVRRRDGARHWTLLRDLNDPELWVERYDAATWAENVRHNERITKADAQIGERLRGLTIDGAVPVVRRLIGQDMDADRDEAATLLANDPSLADPARQS